MAGEGLSCTHLATLQPHTRILGSGRYGSVVVGVQGTDRPPRPRPQATSRASLNAHVTAEFATAARMST